MQQDVLRRGVAEFVGTFTLIFIGGGAGIVSGSDIVAVALANGLAIGIMVTNLGHISGGHFNPAITLGFVATRRITPPLAVAYWIAQLRGDDRAAAILRGLFTHAQFLAAVPHAASFGAGKGFLLEIDEQEAPGSTAAFTIASDDKSLSAAVNKSELGGATGFEFIILTTDGDLSDGHFDDAPSGAGSFDYKQQETFELTLAAAKATTAKAGGSWNLVVSVTRSDTGLTLGPEATIACKGTSGTKKLALSTRAFVSSGSGGISVAVCGFKVAKALKGKTLHGTISVSYKGQTVTKTFTAKTK